MSFNVSSGIVDMVLTPYRSLWFSLPSQNMGNLQGLLLNHLENICFTISTPDATRQRITIPDDIYITDGCTIESYFNLLLERLLDVVKEAIEIEPEAATLIIATQSSMKDDLIFTITVNSGEDIVQHNVSSLQVHYLSDIVEKAKCL